MVRNAGRWMAVGLAALLMGGCGRGVEIQVVEGGAPEAVVLPPRETPDVGTKIGLMDPSPMEGGKIVGPVTYAFRPGPEGAEPKRGGEVRAALLQDVDTFNPFLSSSAAASEVQDLIYPRLMFEQPDYYDGVPTFDPQIAEDWTFQDNNTAIRFKLRECTWSDGTPITSHDIRFSWEAAKDPDVAWVSHSIVDFIQDVEVHNDREFTVRYTKSTPYNIMDINDVQIVPKHTFGKVPFSKWRKHPDWGELALQACGGPWVMDRHVAGQEIALKPNPRYWDKGKPYLDRLVFKIFGDMGSMLKALRAGQIDIMNSVQPHLAHQVIEHPDLYLYTYVARSYGYAGWNCKRFPFDDARVRRAMAYAVNRKDIVASQFHGHAETAAPFIIRSMWASARDQKPLPHDPVMAENLLREAGWTRDDEGWTKDGRRLAFKLMTNSGNPVRKAICERMISDLARIGVDVKMDLIDFNQMSSKLKAHEFQAYVGGWYIATKIDPKPTFHSLSVDGRYNYVNYMNPTLDRLIDRGRTMDITQPEVREEAMQVWRTYQEILHHDQPYMMIYEPRGLVGLSKRFVNVRVTSLRWLDNVHEWWIEE